MAYSSVSYTGNGSTKDFPITFPYLAPNHVLVYVDGVLKIKDLDYSLITGPLIRFTVAPVNGSIVTIQRNSNRQARLTDFQDYSVLTESNLDYDSNQIFYISQEAFDVASQGVTLDVDNVLDAHGKRIKNVADPVYPQDAATKTYVDSLGGAIPQIKGIHGATWVIPSGPITLPTNDVYVYVPRHAVIQSAVLLTQGGPGNCVVDIWKGSLGGPPPTSANSICGSSKPTITNGNTYSDSTLTGWSTEVNIGDTLVFNLVSTDTFGQISIVLTLGVI
jgi:hypothetical protein